MEKPHSHYLERWKRFLVGQEVWLSERMLASAKSRGYVRYTSTLTGRWRISVSTVSEALVEALDALGPEPPEFSPEDSFAADPISAFGVREAHRHRERGVSLPMFLGLLKYVRRAYADLVREEGRDVEGRDGLLRFIERFFDRLEIAVSADWVGLGEERRIGELQECNRDMTNEKNKFLTLFESLVTPVLLLDDDLNVEAMNRAAIQHLSKGKRAGLPDAILPEPGESSIRPPRRVPLRELAPWLAGPLADRCDMDRQPFECLLDAEDDVTPGRRHFKVSVARMSDISDKFSGLTLVLDDITRMVDIQAQLEGERNRVARYLDIIGSVLLGLDASANITLINKAGKEILGRSGEDLLGRNWIDLAVPVEERPTVRNYFRAVFEGSVRVEDERVNHLRTRDGELRLVSWRNRLIRNEEGVPVGVLCAGTDITARVKAERLLRDREMTYRALFENNHAVMLLADPRDGSIRDANPAAAAFYGLPVETLRTMNMSDINVLSETETYQEMIDARAQRRSYFLLRHRLASGEERDVEVYSGPVMVQGRQLLYSLVHDVTRRIRLEREMERLATTDALTGADNRHQFFRRAEAELRRAARYGHPLSVIMLDIDLFKEINDTYGHHSGDLVLKALVERIGIELRETDVFGRLGGEEFAVVLPETGAEGGWLVAERLRRIVEDLRVRDEGENVIRFTLSLGVAGLGDPTEGMEAILRRADKALYRAKGLGRNRVEQG